MKRTILTAALAACALSATAQIMEERNPVPMTPGGGRVYRTEVVPYDARHDAEARNREAGGYWKAFEPEVTIATEGPLHAVLEQEIEIPFAWTDGMVYLHVENPGSAYSLWLNDRQVAEVSDPLTPAEFDLTPFIREGANDFKLLLISWAFDLNFKASFRMIRKQGYLQALAATLPDMPETRRAVMVAVSHANESCE